MPVGHCCDVTRAFKRCCCRVGAARALNYPGAACLWSKLLAGGSTLIDLTPHPTGSAPSWLVSESYHLRWYSSGDENWNFNYLRRYMILEYFVS